MNGLYGDYIYYIYIRINIYCNCINMILEIYKCSGKDNLYIVYVN